MAFDSFRDFVNALHRAGELKRIAQPVATELEITETRRPRNEIARRRQGAAVEKPTIAGVVSPFPVAINTLGSHKRMAMSMGADSVEEVAERTRLADESQAANEFQGSHQTARARAGFAPRQTENWSRAAHARMSFRSLMRCVCQESRSKRRRCWPPAPDRQSTRTSSGPRYLPTLLNLPILKCWPLDGGRFITLPCVVTKDPDTGERNVGMYRIQIYDDKTTGMHWQLQKVGARHGRRYYETGTRMPVSIFIGGDPMFTFAATAPLPDGLDEFLLAGYLRKKSVELVKCETNDLEVPANADFVIEGYIDPTEPLREEGPFGDHTGYYTLPEPYPVFHVTAITHRKDAVYPATIVGIPPMEDFYIGGASVKLFLPIFKMNFPEIVDIALPAEGVFHNLVFVSIKKTYPMQAYKIMHGLWGMGQMMFTKYIVVVDAGVNVHNTSEVLFHLTANTDPQRDSIFTKGPSDVLDHATSEIASRQQNGF